MFHDTTCVFSPGFLPVERIIRNTACKSQSTHTATHQQTTMAEKT